MSVRLTVALDGRVARASTTRTDEDGLAGAGRPGADRGRAAPGRPRVRRLRPGRARRPGRPLGRRHRDGHPRPAGRDRGGLRGRRGGGRRRRRLLLDAGPAPGAGVHRAASGPPPGPRWPRSTASTASAPATASPRPRPWRCRRLDGAACGARAAAKARAGVDPIELPPGRYEVVLEPRAVAATLLFPAYLGFNGKAHADGTSFVHLGELAVGREHRHLGRRHRPPGARGSLRRRGHAQAPGRPGAGGGVGGPGPRPPLGRPGGRRADRPLRRVRGVRRLPRPTCSSEAATAAAGRAGGRRRAGPARDRPLVQPHPRPQDPGRDRAHPQRPVPDRGRVG